uniref:PX domain-containing protein n=1 Tax=Globisporangium ultimum (strain ATCC 200006 / CBS 805.95 / DAOM BR144) TaxID=431595 RepID=K3X9T1_GLOUD
MCPSHSTRQDQVSSSLLVSTHEPDSKVIADNEVSVAPLTSSEVNKVDLLPSADMLLYSSGGAGTLNRIECVNVTKKIKRRGLSLYVIDVHVYRSESLSRVSDLVDSSSATSRTSMSELRELLLADREPAYQIEHRFVDFQELKSALQRVAKKHAAYCSHCQTLNAFLGHRNNSSWRFKRIVKSKAQRKVMLSNFVNGVLSLTSECEANNRVCRVNRDVSSLVERFVRRQYVESLGII